MKTGVSAQLLAHIAGEVTTLAYCWVITRTDGNIYRFTDHDCDLVIATHTYLATQAMGGTDLKQDRTLAADNMEAMAILDSESITESDLRAGLFDGASIDMFLVNWADTSMGILSIIQGWHFGDVRLGDTAFAVEILGLASTLQNNICEMYSETCRAELGDARCKVALAGYTRIGTVFAASVATPRQRCTLDVDSAFALSEMIGGSLTWTGGDNTGLVIEIAAVNEATGELTLLVPMPADIAIGDSFSVVRGCDKTFGTCVNVFSNPLNFRGEPWVPLEGTLRVWSHGKGGNEWG